MARMKNFYKGSCSLSLRALFVVIGFACTFVNNWSAYFLIDNIPLLSPINSIEWQLRNQRQTWVWRLSYCSLSILLQASSFISKKARYSSRTSVCVKTVHWIAGFLRVGLNCIHGLQFRKMLAGMRSKFRWFWDDTWAEIAFSSLTFITGPLKIAVAGKNTAFWDYWFGVIMSAEIIVHLIKGIPSWIRQRNIKSVK